MLIEKTGSSVSNYIYNSTFAVQSYAESYFQAASLNEVVINFMMNIIELGDIASCRLNSDYNFTDSETKRYRYQAVFDITH